MGLQATEVPARARSDPRRVTDETVVTGAFARGTHDGFTSPSCSPPSLSPWKAALRPVAGPGRSLGYSDRPHARAHLCVHLADRLLRRVFERGARNSRQPGRSGVCHRRHPVRPDLPNGADAGTRCGPIPDYRLRRSDRVGGFKDAGASQVRAVAAGLIMLALGTAVVPAKPALAPH